MRCLVYLHGFRSSPLSHKATLLAEYVSNLNDIDIIIPELPEEPAAAIKKIHQVMKSLQGVDVLLVGSSLGGFYATSIAEHYHCPAVLINPAVRPYELLEEYTGQNVNMHTGEVFEFKEAYVEQLKEIECKSITNVDSYLVLLQQGDEVLDYRQAMENYKDSYVNVSTGGSHAFDEFEKVINDIIMFGFNRADYLQSV